MTKTMSLLVIAPWGQDVGFRLGGARVTIAPDEETLNGELEEAIARGDTGVVAVPETMREWISAHNQRLLARNPFPLLAFYHFPDEWRSAEDAGEEIAELARRAIGYRLKIRL